MELKIEKKEQKLLVDRVEIVASLESKKTPSNLDVQEEIAKQFNKVKELVVVKHIFSGFGCNSIKIIAYVYNKIESLKKFEKVGKKKVVPGTETTQIVAPAPTPKVEEKKE